MKKKLIIFSFLVIAIASTGGWWWYHQPLSTSVPPLPQVRIQPIKKANVPLILKLPGVLQAEQTVEIKSRIDGMILQVHFKEGDIVYQGQLLFTLDGQELQARYTQAKATLAQNQILVNRAAREVNRQESLSKKGLVEQNKYEDLVANHAKLLAEQIGLKAAIDELATRLSYTHIKAPLTAIAGFIKVDAGNYIRTSEDLTLVSLMQVDPLETVVQIPEKFLSYLLKTHFSSLNATIYDVQGNLLEYPARVDSLDNTVNPITSTIGLKIKINNLLRENHPALMPGQYITTDLKVTTFENALVIPLSAVQTGQAGSYTFVYDPNTQKVHYQPVIVGHTTLEEAIITKGLKAHQYVVTNGHLRLKDNMTVKALK